VNQASCLLEDEPFKSEDERLRPTQGYQELSQLGPSAFGVGIRFDLERRAAAVTYSRRQHLHGGHSDLAYSWRDVMRTS